MGKMGQYFGSKIEPKAENWKAAEQPKIEIEKALAVFWQQSRTQSEKPESGRVA